MKIRLAVSLSGTRDGVDWPQRGEIVDLPDAEAVDMLNARLAVPVVAEPETATIPAPVEKATRTRKRG